VAEVAPDILARYSRFPEQATADEPTDEFLRLACLTYSHDDDPARWTQAREVLRVNPGIAGGNIYVAAVLADIEALRRVLASDPEASAREGGPFRWTPLCYLAYARHDPGLPARAVLDAARLLIDAGADPNEGYLWHGLVPPFTVLTGVFGEGELGPVRQPRHPHSLALARLLLEAGADPNDGQALYNRMFEPGNDHLELLLAFGLGGGDGGPWRRLLGDAHDTPAVMIRGQLAWAITHGMTERVRLLAERGHVDLTAPFGDQDVTVTAMAATTGHLDLVPYLVARGAPALDLAPDEDLIAAALAANRPRVDALLATHPGLLDQVRVARPALVAWAVACESVPAVELLVELGFDVNAMGRTDIPSDQPWQTALHKAAGDGNAELATALLRLGADPGIRDARFDGTPLDWARHACTTTPSRTCSPTTHADASSPVAPARRPACRPHVADMFPSATPTRQLNSPGGG
jgi:ankyrin repeat protein